MWDIPPSLHCCSPHTPTSLGTLTRGSLPSGSSTGRGSVSVQAALRPHTTGHGVRGPHPPERVSREPLIARTRAASAAPAHGWHPLRRRPPRGWHPLYVSIARFAGGSPTLRPLSLRGADLRPRPPPTPPRQVARTCVFSQGDRAEPGTSMGPRVPPGVSERGQRAADAGSSPASAPSPPAPLPGAREDLPGQSAPPSGQPPHRAGQRSHASRRVTETPHGYWLLLLWRY